MKTVCSCGLGGLGRPPETGFLDKTIEYNGAQVKCIVYVPRLQPRRAPAPILFLHGRASRATTARSR
jgi:hypothetical protein